MNVELILERKGTEVFTVAPDRTVAEAVSLLRDRRVGALVVSPDGAALAGIVSERDVVHRLAEEGPALLDRPVSDIMTADVLTCRRSDSAREVLAVMTGRRVRHLPVIEDGRLAGLISIGDAVKIRLDEAVAEAEALRNYIAHG